MPLGFCGEFSNHTSKVLTSLIAIN